MKVTDKKIENRQALLTIEMEPAEVDESLEKAYHRLVRKANIPGFRKGKAPRQVLERHLGKEGLFEDALDHLLPEAYARAIKEQEIQPFAQPHIEITQTEPLIFKATVPLLPEVELGDYQNIRLVAEKADVKEADVDAVVEELKHQYATWEPVERPAIFGDLVVLDIESSAENVPFINQKAIQYQLVQKSTYPIPGFAEQLSGMKRDEEKEFKIQLPSDYPRAEVAGKEASFRIKLTEIKQEKLPELNEDFAKGINPDFKTMDTLREQIMNDLKLRAEQKVKVEFEEHIIDLAVEQSKVEFPPALVEIEIDRLLQQRLRRGGQGMKEYLNEIKKTEAELRDELRPLAARRVTRSLVLGKIVEAEKIEVNESEVDVEIENIKKTSTGNKAEVQKALKTPQAHESIEDSLITQKVIQRLVEIAQGAVTDAQPLPVKPATE